MKFRIDDTLVIEQNPSRDFPIMLSLTRTQAPHLYNMLGAYREDGKPTSVELAVIESIDAVLERSL